MKPAHHPHHDLPRIENHDCAFSVPAEARVAANDVAHRQRERERESEPLGPLWVIAIAMGGFLLVTGLVLALG